MKRIIVIVLISALMIQICGCSDTSEQSTQTTTAAISQPKEAATTETTAPISEETISTTELSPVSEVKLNTDAFSELGMTYPKFVEKYGEPTGGWYNVYSFENSNGGGYAFEWENMTSEEDLKNIGSCFMIDGVYKEKLFEKIEFPMSFEQLETAYGIECIYAPDDKDEMFELYRAQFTAEQYPDAEILLYTAEKGILDEKASCVIRVLQTE